MNILTSEIIKKEIRNIKSIILFTFLTCLFIWLTFEVTFYAIFFAFASFIILDTIIKLQNKIYTDNYYILKDKVKKRISNSLIECNFGKITIGKKAGDFNIDDDIFLVMINNAPILIYKAKDWKLDHDLESKVKSVIIKE